MKEAFIYLVLGLLASGVFYVILRLIYKKEEKPKKEEYDKYSNRHYWED